jgi:hypothetical protein
MCAESAGDDIEDSSFRLLGLGSRSILVRIYVRFFPVFDLFTTSLSSAGSEVLTNCFPGSPPHLINRFWCELSKAEVASLPA